MLVFKVHVYPVLHICDLCVSMYTQSSFLRTSPAYMLLPQSSLCIPCFALIHCRDHNFLSSMGREKEKWPQILSLAFTLYICFKHTTLIQHCHSLHSNWLVGLIISFKVLPRQWKNSVLYYTQHVLRGWILEWMMMDTEKTCIEMKRPFLITNL